jgi:hypothetical protein
VSGTGPGGGGGLPPLGGGEVVEKRGRRVSIVQILCTHVSKCKSDTCRNYSRNGGGGIGE